MRRYGSPPLVEKPFSKFDELSYVGAGPRSPVRSLETLEQVLASQRQAAKLKQAHHGFMSARGNGGTGVIFDASIARVPVPRAVSATVRCNPFTPAANGAIPVVPFHCLHSTSMGDSKGVDCALEGYGDRGQPDKMQYRGSTFSRDGAYHDHKEAPEHCQVSGGHAADNEGAIAQSRQRSLEKPKTFTELRNPFSRELVLAGVYARAALSEPFAHRKLTTLYLAAVFIPLELTLCTLPWQHQGQRQVTAAISRPGARRNSIEGLRWRSSMRSSSNDTTTHKFYRASRRMSASLGVQALSGRVWLEAAAAAAACFAGRTQQ